MKEKGQRRLTILIILVLITAIGTIGILTNKNKNLEMKYDTKPLNDPELEEIYYGEKNAENEILFVFDYSCPACHEWIISIFPEIKNSFIDPGVAKFRTQSMVYLNDDSLKFSNFDQNLKRKYPKQYFEILFDLLTYDPANGIEHNLLEAINKYDLSDELLNKPTFDSLNITRKYTRNLNVEVVPTIYVNGNKIDDPFNLKEIKRNLN